MKDPIVPAAVIKAETSLVELAAAINAEHEAGEAATRAGIGHYRRAGERLLRAKKP